MIARENPPRVASPCVRRCTFLLFVAGAALPAQANLAAELARLVDTPTPAARAQVARDLGSRRDVSFDDWLLAMREFGAFAARPSGEHVERVDLQVGDVVEATELWIYVPSSYDPAKAAPLLFMGHGTGGSGEGLCGMWRSVADDLGMLVLAPSEAGPNGGYAFSARERAAALAAIRWMRRRFHVDENRIFAAGISRGGHLAWDLALRYPDVFAAIVPMIGGPRINPAQGQNNLRYLENVRELSIRDLQGLQDDPGLVANVQMAFKQLAALGARDAVLHAFKDRGHSFDFGAVDWRAFFGAKKRSASPIQVVRAFARPGEGRAFWMSVTSAERGVQEDVPLRVEEAEWKRLQADNLAMRAFLADEATKRTARLQVTRAGGNRFDAVGVRVRTFRLLLSLDMFDPSQPVEVRFAGRTHRLRPTPSARVALSEFGERFDRTFLPVVEVVVPP